MNVKSGKDFEVWLKKALKDVKNYDTKWGMYSDSIIEFLNSPYGQRTKEIIKNYIDKNPQDFKEFEMGLYNTTKNLDDFIDTWFDTKDKVNFYTFLNYETYF